MYCKAVSLVGPVFYLLVYYFVVYNFIVQNCMLIGLCCTYIIYVFESIINIIISLTKILIKYLDFTYVSF